MVPEKRRHAIVSQSCNGVDISNSRQQLSQRNLPEHSPKPSGNYYNANGNLGSNNNVISEEGLRDLRRII